jgi:hypothetical protein
MIPLALGMLRIELWLLSHLLVDGPLPRLAPIRFSQPAPLGARRCLREAQVMH